MDDWIVDGSVSDTMAVFISYPQDKSDHTFSIYVNRSGLSFGYLLGVLADTPSDIGTLPNNLYVIWMFVFLGIIVAGVSVDIYLKMKGRI